MVKKDKASVRATNSAVVNNLVQLRRTTPGVTKRGNKTCCCGRAGAPFHQSVNVDLEVASIALLEVGYDECGHHAVCEGTLALESRDEELD